MRTASVLSLLVVVASCGSKDGEDRSPGGADGVEATSLFVVPTSLDELKDDRFFEHPFPSDVRRESDGTVRFAGWPNPNANALVAAYLKSTDHLLDGFSPDTPIYMRFTGPIDRATLPADPPASAAPGSSLQLVDVDPRSPEKGQRRLVQTYWHETVTDGSYWQPNTLAVMPILGRPLRPKTRYALVVTNKVRAKGGGALGPSADLAEVLSSAPSTRTKDTHDLYVPAVTELGALGIRASDIVHLSVFTTNDPTAELFAVADDVRANVAPPTVRGWSAKDTTADYDVYEGTYGPSPNYQSGTPPYASPSDGGGFVFEAGKPTLQSTFDLRFALAVPNASKCPPPEGGYPVVLYAHGTGGDYRSYLRDDIASALAQRCLASMGVDQIFHGTRLGAPAASDPSRESKTQLLFFNFDNAIAARTNNRQSAIDVLQQARLFSESKTKVPAAISRTSADIGFDPSRVLFFGHSQGGLNGPLFLAASDLARGGVLSGAGSVIAVALIDKTKPVDVASFVRILLGLGSDENDELNVFHPALALAQTIVDAADPIHYGVFITTAPRAGFAAKSIYQTEGVGPDGAGDSYAPPRGIEALAVSMRLPRIAPGVKPIAESSWLGLADLTVSGAGVTGNLGAGRATGALAQFTPSAGRDGHFVVFDVPRARSQAAEFCRELAADPAGRLHAP